MKKGYLSGGIVVVVAVVITTVALAGGKDNTKSSTKTASTKTSSGNFKVVDACDILTLADAQKLDAGAAKGDGASSGASTADITVSDCSYYDSATRTSISILARSAKTDDGASSNQGQFAKVATGDEAVTGYGDKAYWAPAYGQFNILAHNNWYILSYGGLTPTSRTLIQTKQLADLILNQL